MEKLFSNFEVFKFRNYRILAFGLFVSFIGTQMQIVGVSWHLYQLTKSAYNLGLVGVAGVLPILFFSPFAGVLIDAVDRKKLLMINQILFCLVTGAFGVLTLLHYDTPLLIYAVIFISSILVVLDLPARQTIIPALVPKSHLLQAFSMYAILRQTSIIIGPTIAGFIIASYNVAFVYFVNSFSFFILCIILVFISFPKQEKQQKSAISLSAVFEGIKYIAHSPILYATMILDFFANFFAASTFIFPIFASVILHVGPRGLGLLYAAPSIGAVTAGLISGMLSHIRQRGKLFLTAVIIYGCATIGFGLSRSFVLSLICLAFVGGADMISMVVRTSLTQFITPDYIRGRMNAINMMFFAGGPFLGEAEAGFAAGLLGAPAAVVIGGLGAVISALFVTLFVPKLTKYEQGEK